MRSSFVQHHGEICDHSELFEPISTMVRDKRASRLPLVILEAFLRTMRFLVNALAVLAGFGAKSDAEPAQHLGPVTDIIVHQNEVYSCSQAGILVGRGANVKLLNRPTVRLTALAAGGPEQAQGIYFAGGEPGQSGILGKLDLNGHEPQVLRSDLGGDLVYDLTMSRNGRVAWARSDGKVESASPPLSTSKVTLAHRHSGVGRAVAFSPDGKWLASVGLDGVVKISPGAGPVEGLEVQSLEDHTAGIECLCFSPDSKRLVSGSRDSKVRLHTVSGKLVRTYHGLGMEDEPVAGRVTARVLSLVWKGELLLAGTSNGRLYQLALSDDKMTRVSRSGTDPIHALEFAPLSLNELLLGGLGRLQTVILD